MEGVKPSFDNINTNAKVESVRGAILVEFRDDCESVPVLNEDGFVYFIGHGESGRLILEAVRHSAGVVNVHGVGVRTTVVVRVGNRLRGGRHTERGAVASEDNIRRAIIFLRLLSFELRSQA
jgi:hypothetical protein